METNLFLVDVVTGKVTPIKLVDPAVVFADVIAERAAKAALVAQLAERGAAKVAPAA